MIEKGDLYRVLKNGFYGLKKGDIVVLLSIGYSNNVGFYYLRLIRNNRIDKLVSNWKIEELFERV